MSSLSGEQMPMKANAKQSSVIERELDALRSLVNKVGSLTQEITWSIWPDVPNNEEVGRLVITVSDAISDICTDVDSIAVKLGRINECLHEQLGSLKLDS
jgi:hypothetical protein